MEYYTLNQLAALVGRKVRTLRAHHQAGWLVAEKVPGAVGLRVSDREARKWAAKRLAMKLQ